MARPPKKPIKNRKQEYLLVPSQYAVRWKRLKIFGLETPKTWIHLTRTQSSWSLLWTLLYGPVVTYSIAWSPSFLVWDQEKLCGWIHPLNIGGPRINQIISSSVAQKGLKTLEISWQLNRLDWDWYWWEQHYCYPISLLSLIHLLRSFGLVVTKLLTMSE